MNFGVWYLEMWMCPVVTGFDVEHAVSATRELVVYMLKVKNSSCLCCCLVLKGHSDLIFRVKHSKKMQAIILRNVSTGVLISL
jgi:hypothetical protein